MNRTNPGSEGISRIAQVTDAAIDALQAEVKQLRGYLEAAEPVLEYVSRGRGFVGVEPYPDATARRVLGAIRE